MKLNTALNKRLGLKRNKNLFFLLINSNRKNFKNKLNEFNKSWEGIAHEKTQATSNVIYTSEPIYFRDLSDIQST